MKGAAYHLYGGSESQFGLDLATLQQAFVDKIQSYYPNNPVIWMPLEAVQMGLLEQVEMAKKHFDNPLFVSLSPLYYQNAEVEVSCNRVVDLDGNPLGLTERPGSMPLRQQINRVMELAGNRPIVVVDDTLFHGDTIQFLLGMGLRINGAVEYFADQKTASDLTDSGFPVFASKMLVEYLDVMPLHDFLPPLPMCGKVVGHMSNDEVHYLGEENNISYSKPYIMPFITATQMSKWASIPWEFTGDFSAFALSQMIILANRLSAVGFDTMDKAMKYHMRTSWPYLPGSLYAENVTIEEILRRAFHYSLA